MNAAEIRKSKIATYKALVAAFDQITEHLMDTVDDDVNWEDAEPSLDSLRMDLHERSEAMFFELWPGKTVHDADVVRELA